jgi:Fe-S cluster biosynthesis and repair protein YggX
MTSPTADPPRPPDLQQLVAKHGRYDKITPAAWAEWDAQDTRYQTERRRRLTEESRDIAQEIREVKKEGATKG